MLECVKHDAVGRVADGMHRAGDAGFAGFADQCSELARIRAVLQTQHDGLMRRIAQLFQDHQDAVACNALATDALDDIRKQLNAVSYVKKLLSQV